MAKLRAADDTLAYAVAATLNDLTLSPEDRGVARLAALYADQIDGDPSQIEALGPKLLTALEALGASPRARAAIRKPPSSAVGRLEAIRGARRA